MKLFTSEGVAVRGFDRVIFCKNVSEKLCSVGELCNAGYVFVFDENKLTLYEKNNFSVKGKIITSSPRNQRSGLYPISFFRKEKVIEEKKVTCMVAISAPAVANIASLSIYKNFLSSISSLPLCIVDAPIPAIYLAKSYSRPDLSELDQYHAKFGDVGIKYMKRCLPSLKIPKQYRCDICIDGKIHKFGHKKCEKSIRKIYLPGVCIHSDHSGPYAKSLSDSRYSQLYLDRGSGYLWAFRQKKKTDHYDSTRKVFMTSGALSGRKVQDSKRWRWSFYLHSHERDSGCGKGEARMECALRL